MTLSVPIARSYFILSGHAWHAWHVYPKMLHVKNPQPNKLCQPNFAAEIFSGRCLCMKWETIRPAPATAPWLEGWAPSKHKGKFLRVCPFESKFGKMLTLLVSKRALSRKVPPNVCLRCALAPGRRIMTLAAFSPRKTASTTLQGGLIILRTTNNIQILYDTVSGWV